LRVANPTAFGVLDIVDSHVRRIIEKPASASPDALANPGIYHFDAVSLAQLQQITPSPRGELELTDLIELLARDYRVGYSISKGHWIPVGTPWDVLLANQFVLQQRSGWLSAMHPEAHVPDDCQINGYVTIGPGAHIGRGCAIVGPAALGAGCTLGSECIIERAVIGAGCTIGRNTTIERSALGVGCSVGTNSILQNSLLDDGAVVGTHVQLLDALFTDAAPAADTRGLLDAESLRQRGTVLGGGVVLPAYAQPRPGSIYFPDAHSAPE
jgi:bifunctional UDP-N-acetylglucosamine pyrophosphorylase/glucosamine-1-phosphate N-acetyltransferase